MIQAYLIVTVILFIACMIFATHLASKQKENNQDYYVNVITMTFYFILAVCAALLLAMVQMRFKILTSKGMLDKVFGVWAEAADYKAAKGIDGEIVRIVDGKVERID